jgi:hypothetical protein
MTATAGGILRDGCGPGGCGPGFGAGGKWGGKFGNHACGKGAGGGFGLFQPPFQAAPWYLYWPYEAHFQLPAPIGGPFFAPQQLTNPAMNPYFSGQAQPVPMPPANQTVPPPPAPVK